MAERAVEFITVPKGTRPSRCRGETCGTVIYFVERQRTGRRTGTVRIPIDCSVEGGAEPDSLTDGRGVSHFTNCPDADAF